MSSLRETLRQQLARFDDDAFAALANRGLLRRARKDLEKETPAIVEENATALIMQFEGQRVEFDARGPAAARCSCPARAACQHVLAAAITLGSLAAEASGITPADTVSLGRDLRALTPQCLRKHAGKAGYRWAWQFVQDLDIENDFTLSGERHIVITFRHPPVSFRYMGGSVDAVLCDSDLKQVEKYRVAAVLAFQRASGQPLEPPEDNGPSSSLERTSGVLSEQRARLLASVCKLAHECVTLGLAHCSSGIQERFSTLAVWAQGARLHRLALLLRRIADHVDMLLERAGGADEQRLFDELTLVYALASALLASAAQGTLPAALVGRARNEYEDVGQLELLGLGASAWRSASGYLGLTMIFWSPSQQAFLSCTDARPELQRFDPVARYKAPGPWSGLGAPAAATGKRIMLAGAMTSTNGRIAASDKTHATVIATDATAFLATLKPWSRWNALALERATRRRSLLAEPQASKDWAVLKPARFERAEFDAARQTLSWTLLDDEGARLTAEVPYDDYTAPVIERLEVFEPRGSVLVVARLRGGTNRLIAEPLSIVNLGTVNAHSPVDSLYFDAAPKTGTAGRLLAKLRTRATVAGPIPAHITRTPPLVTEVKKWLSLQAERGLAGELETTAMDELHRRRKRLTEIGFSAFLGDANTDVGSELLRTHYLCMQIQYLIDASAEEPS